MPSGARFVRQAETIGGSPQDFAATYLAVCLRPWSSTGANSLLNLAAVPELADPDDNRVELVRCD